MDDGVGGLDAVELGDVAGGLGEDARGVQGAAGGEGLEGFDVGFEDADVAGGEAGGGAAALLEFLLAGGGAGFDEDVADAKLLDEAEGFLAGAGADGEHADDAADAEDDAEGGEQGAGLLGAQVGDGLAEVGEKDHLARAFMAPPDWAAPVLSCWSGLDMATISPSLMPVTTA